MYKVKYLLNYILKEAEEKGIQDINNQKINKLIYIMQGYSLALLNKPLISDDIQIWKYGVMIPEIYHMLSKTRNARVYAEDFNKYDINLPKDISNLIDQVLEAYGFKSPVILSSILNNNPVSFKERLDKIEEGDLNGLSLSNSEIKDYYKKKLKEYFIEIPKLYQDKTQI